MMHIYECIEEAQVGKRKLMHTPFHVQNPLSFFVCVRRNNYQLLLNIPFARDKLIQKH